MLNEKEFRILLEDLLENHGFGEWDEEDDEDEEDGVSVQKYRNFEEFGMLTRDEGIVVDMTDGTRFAITIKEMRR